MRRKKVSFKNNRGLTLTGFIYEPKKYDTAVVYCHGFPSSAVGSMGRRIGPSLAKLGYLTLCFNFSHTPGSEGKFEDKLMSREVKDIRAAIDFLEKARSFKKLILFGHSTGAIDAALYAHSDKRISKLILGGVVSDLKNAVHYDFTDYQVKDFWTKRFITYHRKGKWVDGLRMKKAFYDEFFTLDIPKSIKKYRRPLLIVHGEKDLIPFEIEAKALYKMANKPKKLVMVKNADHSFSKPNHWSQMINTVHRFIK